MHIKKVVIPAAGLGTRFLPASKIVPKELLPIVDKPSIQYIVEEAIESGIEEIIFVISKGKENVVDHFKPYPELEKILKQKNKNEFLKSITELQNKANFKTVYQNEPKGLGHAVLCAKEIVGNEWFFVMLPDDLIDAEKPTCKQMLEVFDKFPGSIVAVMEVLWEEVHQYGIVKGIPMESHLGSVENVIEKPARDQAPSNLAIIGRYLLPPEIFSYIEQTAPGAIGEIQLTDALHKIIKSPTKLYSFQFHGERFDVGNKQGFIEANIHYGLKDNSIREKILDSIKLTAASH